MSKAELIGIELQMRELLGRSVDVGTEAGLPGRTLKRPLKTLA
jgi:hypothetical protein